MAAAAIAPVAKTRQAYPFAPSLGKPRAAFTCDATDLAPKQRAGIPPEVIVLHEQAELTGTVHQGVIVID